jgi:hypothetical protein
MNHYCQATIILTLIIDNKFFARKGKSPLLFQNKQKDPPNLIVPFIREI